MANTENKETKPMSDTSMNTNQANQWLTERHLIANDSVSAGLLFSALNAVQFFCEGMRPDKPLNMLNIMHSQGFISPPVNSHDKAYDVSLGVNAAIKAVVHFSNKETKPMSDNSMIHTNIANQWLYTRGLITKNEGDARPWVIINTLAKALGMDDGRTLIDKMVANHLISVDDYPTRFPFTDTDALTPVDAIAAIQLIGIPNTPVLPIAPMPVAVAVEHPHDIMVIWADVGENSLAEPVSTLASVLLSEHDTGDSLSSRVSIPHGFDPIGIVDAIRLEMDVELLRYEVVTPKALDDLNDSLAQQFERIDELHDAIACVQGLEQDLAAQRKRVTDLQTQTPVMKPRAPEVCNACDGKGEICVEPMMDWVRCTECRPHT